MPSTNEQYSTKNERDESPTNAYGTSNGDPPTSSG